MISQSECIIKVAQCTQAIIGNAKAKPFADVFPDLAVSIRKGRGPNKAPTKKLVTIRLSGSVIEKYKSGGAGWQSRIDSDLKRINKIK